MKRNLLLTTLLAFAFSGLVAQTGTKVGMVLKVTIDGDNFYYFDGVTSCGFSSVTWGGTLTEEVCGEVVWGRTPAGDSIGCSALIPNSLDGKIGMIRRATCEFGTKALVAEQAGAVAVIIANGTAATHLDDCNSPAMGAGVQGASVTIPVIMLSRVVVNQIDDALKAGKTVTTCFVLPRVSAPFAGYQYATPISQVTELTTLGFNFNNREVTDISGMTIKAEITEPDGHVTVLESAVPNLAPGADTLLFFEGYTPPALVGDFNVVFTNNKYSEVSDTLRRKFVQTEYTYAVDNLSLKLDGGAQLNDRFAVDKIYQVGSLTATGPNPSVATHITFGIANIGLVYLPGNSTANTITAFVYKADSDNDGRIDFVTDFSDMEIVGVGTYEMTGNETESGLVDIALSDFSSGDLGVGLDGNALYYASIQYDGNENGSGQNCAFTNTEYVPYLFFPDQNGSLVATAPIKLGGQRSYWGDRTIVNRLQLEGYVPGTVAVKPNLLDANKYTIAPNPAIDNVQIGLNLAKQSNSVIVSVINPMGEQLSSQVLKNFKEGQVNLDVKNVPSGLYLVTIKTDEGVGVKKVMICH